MHRSSDPIGNISAALAKAQAEVTNPEKSLVAVGACKLVPAFLRPAHNACTNGT
jgi:hypothetical protein